MKKVNINLRKINPKQNYLDKQFLNRNKKYYRLYLINQYLPIFQFYSAFLKAQKIEKIEDLYQVNERNIYKYLRYNVETKKIEYFGPFNKEMFMLRRFSKPAFFQLFKNVIKKIGLKNYILFSDIFKNSKFLNLYKYYLIVENQKIKSLNKKFENFKNIININTTNNKLIFQYITVRRRLIRFYLKSYHYFKKYRFQNPKIIYCYPYHQFLFYEDTNLKRKKLVNKTLNKKIKLKEISFEKILQEKKNKKYLPLIYFFLKRLKFLYTIKKIKLTFLEKQSLLNKIFKYVKIQFKKNRDLKKKYIKKDKDNKYKKRLELIFKKVYNNQKSLGRLRKYRVFFNPPRITRKKKFIRYRLRYYFYYINYYKNIKNIYKDMEKNFFNIFRTYQKYLLNKYFNISPFFNYKFAVIKLLYNDFKKSNRDIKINFLKFYKKIIKNKKLSIYHFNLYLKYLYKLINKLINLYNKIKIKIGNVKILKEKNIKNIFKKLQKYSKSLEKTNNTPSFYVGFDMINQLFSDIRNKTVLFDKLYYKRKPKEKPVHQRVRRSVFVPIKKQFLLEKNFEDKLLKEYRFFKSLEVQNTKFLREIKNSIKNEKKKQDSKSIYLDDLKNKKKKVKSEKNQIKIGKYLLKKSVIQMKTKPAVILQREIKYLKNILKYIEKKKIINKVKKIKKKNFLIFFKTILLKILDLYKLKFEALIKETEVKLRDEIDVEVNTSLKWFQNYWKLKEERDLRIKYESRYRFFKITKSDIQQPILKRYRRNEKRRIIRLNKKIKKKLIILSLLKIKTKLSKIDLLNIKKFKKEIKILFLIRKQKQRKRKRFSLKKKQLKIYNLVEEEEVTTTQGEKTEYEEKRIEGKMQKIRKEKFQAEDRFKKFFSIYRKKQDIKAQSKYSFFFDMEERYLSFLRRIPAERRVIQIKDHIDHIKEDFNYVYNNYLITKKDFEEDSAIVKQTKHDVYQGAHFGTKEAIAFAAELRKYEDEETVLRRRKKEFIKKFSRERLKKFFNHPVDYRQTRNSFLKSELIIKNQLKNSQKKKNNLNILNAEREIFYLEAKSFKKINLINQSKNSFLLSIKKKFLPLNVDSELKLKSFYELFLQKYLYKLDIFNFYFKFIKKKLKRKEKKLLKKNKEKLNFVIEKDKQKLKEKLKQDKKVYEIQNLLNLIQKICKKKEKKKDQINILKQKKNEINDSIELEKLKLSIKKINITLKKLYFLYKKLKKELNIIYNKFYFKIKNKKKVLIKLLLKKIFNKIKNEKIKEKKELIIGIFQNFYKIYKKKFENLIKKNKKKYFFKKIPILNNKYKLYLIKDKKNLKKIKFNNKKNIKVIKNKYFLKNLKEEISKKQCNILNFLNGLKIKILENEELKTKKKKQKKIIKIIKKKKELVCMKLNNIYLFRKFFKFYQFFDKIYIKQVLLKSIHKYTGYKKININLKSLFLSKNKNLEDKYINLYKYNNIINDYNNINYYKKYYLKKKKFNQFIINIFNNWNKFLYKTLYLFPYYDKKIFKSFIKKVYFFYNLPYKNLQLQFKYYTYLLFTMFKYIYKRKNTHFKRAFKFFSLLLYRFFYNHFLPYTGIKIIVKGRFGKNRKQIALLILGYLKLQSISKFISYSNNLMVTKRGSYGFHIWCSFQDKIFNSPNTFFHMDM